MKQLTLESEGHSLQLLLELLVLKIFIGPLGDDVKL